MRKTIVVMAMVFTALVGCSSEISDPPVPRDEVPVREEPMLQMGQQMPDPKEVRIPKIGAESNLVPVGLTPEGAHEVPPENHPEQAAWFRPGPEPGEPGKAIILGHVNGNHRVGVFSRLDELNVGDEVYVDEHRFIVTAVDSALKTQFPADLIYGDTETPELRLVTCGGELDRAAGNYLSNVIVSARLAD